MICKSKTKKELDNKKLKVIPAYMPEKFVRYDTAHRLTEAFDSFGKIYPVLDGCILRIKIDSDDYEFSLYATGNPAVISSEGYVNQPLEDMVVSLFYRMTELSTGETIDADEPVKVIVSGKYDSREFKCPRVIP